jgi:hypothetical protein
MICFAPAFSAEVAALECHVFNLASPKRDPGE